MKKAPGKICSVRLRMQRNKKTIILAAAGIVTAVCSAAAGMMLVPDGQKLPVVLENGEIMEQPWYVTVEGENVAIVTTEAEADQVVKEVARRYKNQETVDLDIAEETAAKEMKLKNGDPKPEILSAAEAADKIERNEELTVFTTEIVTEEKPVKYKEIEKPTDELYIGEQKIAETGKDGKKEVTKKLRKENGRIIRQQTQEEKIIEEPKAKVVLTGTKQPEIMEGQPVPELLRENTASGNPEKPAEEEGKPGKNGDKSKAAAFKIDAGSLFAPLSELRITSEFGPRWGSFHRGVDFGIAAGSPVYAADSGTVVFAGFSGSYGNLIKLDHGNGMVTYYAHCSKLLAAQGQQVERGQLLAEAGSTGNSTGPHLHFEVLVGGANVNPMNYL